MSKVPRVWTGTQWDTLAVTLPDLSNYSTTTQMNTAIGANAGLNLIYSGDVTVGSSATITNVFSSTYANYLIEFIGVSSTNASSEIYFRLNNGSDLSTGIYSYNERTTYSGYDSNTTTNSATSYHFTRIDSSTPKAAGGNLFIKSPYLAQVKTYHGMSYCESNASNHISFMSSGFVNTTSSCTAFTLFQSSGSAVINVKVYGLK